MTGKISFSFILRLLHKKFDHKSIESATAYSYGFIVKSILIWVIVS